MFGLAAVRRECSGNLHPNKFAAQSVPRLQWVDAQIQWVYSSIILRMAQWFLPLIINFSFIQLVVLSSNTDINQEHFSIGWMSQIQFFLLNLNSTLRYLFIHTLLHHQLPLLEYLPISLPIYILLALKMVQFRNILKTYSVQLQIKFLLSLLYCHLGSRGELTLHCFWNQCPSLVMALNDLRLTVGIFPPGKSTKGILLPDLQANCQS